MPKCGLKTEVFSRVVGYLTPVDNWNIGKKSEFADRRAYDGNKALEKSRQEEEKRRIRP